MNLGGGEILVIIVLAVLVLGPDKLPNALRMFGKAMSEVRKFQDMAKSEIDKAMIVDTSTSESKITPENKEPRKESQIAPVMTDEPVMPIVDDGE